MRFNHNGWERPVLYLASQSPRRRELLEQVGATFSVLHVEVPEQRAAGESPQDYVHRVARDKARAGLAHLAMDAHAIVLGSDTEVVLDGDVFGKPRDAEDAAAMLRRLSGRTHEVISAVWLVAKEREQGDVCVSRVRFATLDEATIATYVASGEPFGKAGAYAIQGRGAGLIEYLEGSYSGVMGLPLFETSRLLKSFHSSAAVEA
jgi:septum formation protein